jgi:FkbM family methyltransferase
MKKILVSGDKRFEPFRILRILLNRINHKIARNNLDKFPQVAIFSFDHIGLRINIDGRYERDVLDLISKFFESNIENASENVALDIGANIGNHSLFFANFFKQVISFEPNPRTFDILQFNAKYGASEDKIVPICKALGKEKGKLNFLSNQRNVGGSRVVFANHTASSFEALLSIDVEKADDIDLLKGIKISLMKIDVEGHEIF